MTSEDAHLYLPFVQALAEKKTIQANPNPRDDHGSRWMDMMEIYFDLPPECYRVKPEPPKPREFWVVEYSPGVRTVHADEIKSDHKIIHVREVLPEDAK